MKRTKLYISIFFLFLTLFSCKKQLEEYNPSGLTDNAVFSTPAGFETLVNATYSYARWWYGKEYGYSIAEMGTDLWASGAGDVYPDLTKYVNLQSGQEALGVEWKQLYAAINLCNTGINNIDKVGYPADKLAIRKAELSFLRAFYYWHIVETWGDVNFTTQETVGVLTTANRTPVDKFYEQIFADLNFAVANLPATTADYGRVTKPAAEAFLARMYLTRGKNQEAADLAKKVITSYGFALQPKYADLWRMDNLQNKEVIWAVNYSANLALDDRTDPVLYPTGHPRGAHNGHLLFIMKYDDQRGMVRDIPNGRPFNRYMPTLFYLNLFNTADDSRYTGSFKQAWIANKVDATYGLKIGDTAVVCSRDVLSGTGKKYIVYDRNTVYDAAGLPKDRQHYVSLNKFDDPTRPTVQEEESARDAFVIRLAEMYLIVAEADLNLNNTTEAATYINTIRTRAAIPGHEAVMQVSRAQITLDFILDERARELGGEQLRWFDLKRTGKLIERIKAYNPDAAAIQPFHLVRPIPQSQIDAVTNKDEFKQNPGYQ
ncbi:RagB/SusD family nutrient uptake outer membrane protein [Pedobacter sp. HMF7647]|uniref:RagB/SusD family nutrient uptake outer membrane protein n=1 Tax=Hufsiella arboris TaxID=2695275 RepID=A0A7K1Y4I1_9SPHI|nr:RagB/SusD family nutrient uptake outer membrane protein [Hufsiella arboris]MXV49486.1 RagB/SusD family nutrient uptake outer membrane protein [Hufsiella arboris]